LRYLYLFQSHFSEAIKFNQKTSHNKQKMSEPENHPDHKKAAAKIVETPHA